MPILEDSFKFLKVSEVKDGTIIKFTNEGVWRDSRKFTYPDGSVKKEFVITIEVDGENKSFTLNKTNRDTLKLAWGKDTKEWIGKEARIKLVDGFVGGVMKKLMVVEV